MTVQFVDIAGQKIAMLPAADYERLVDMAEDRFDEDAAARAERRREAGEEYVPASLVNRIIAGESALRVWRQYRELSLAALAEAAGTGPSFVFELENGKGLGKPATWRALANALNVSVDDILPDI